MFSVKETMEKYLTRHSESCWFCIIMLEDSLQHEIYKSCVVMYITFSLTYVSFKSQWILGCTYVMNLLHKSGPSLFGLCMCGLVPFAIGKYESYLKRYKEVWLRWLHHLRISHNYYVSLVSLNFHSLLYKGEEWIR